MTKKNLLVVVAVTLMFTMNMCKMVKSEEIDLADKVVEYATSEDFIGLPYSYGGTSPETGFDCSGYVQYVYAHFGISIPRVTHDQAATGTPIYSIGDLKKGDLVFFYGNDHVGMYIGNNQFVHSPQTGEFIRIDPISEGHYASNFNVGVRILQD